MKLFLVGQSGTLGTALKNKARGMGVQIQCISRTLSNEKSDVCCDLSDIDKIDVCLQDISDKQVDAIAIINSGVLGGVNLASNVNLREASEAFNINALSNIALFQSLYRKGVKRFVVISSGAANKNYSGWFVYCLSKKMQRALWESICNDHSDVSAKLIAPGVLSSSMHNFTDSIDRSNYPDLDKFFSIKESASYQDANESSEKLFSLLNNADFFENGCEFIDLRDM